MAFIDITRSLNNDIAVWPGDDPVAITPNVQREKGDIVNVTTLRMSSHTGTHVDAPYHFADDVPTLDELDLHPFWGKAQVVTITKEAGGLAPADFAEVDLSLAERLLLHTPASHRDPTRFWENFVYPTPELADFLGEQGIILFGTDCPSVDPLGSEVLVGHVGLLKNNIAILEGIDLSLANDGLYQLVALPLKITHGDGSPVRAVLRTLV